jgi:hypothetical protein
MGFPSSLFRSSSCAFCISFGFLTSSAMAHWSVFADVSLPAPKRSYTYIYDDHNMNSQLNARRQTNIYVHIFFTYKDEFLDSSHGERHLEATFLLQPQEHVRPPDPPPARRSCRLQAAAEAMAAALRSWCCWMALSISSNCFRWLA